MKRSVLRWWPPSKRGLLQRKERNALRAMEMLSQSHLQPCRSSLNRLSWRIYYVTSTKAPAAKEESDAHREKVKAARKGKKRARRTRRPAANSSPRRAGWTSQSARMASSTKRESRHCCARAQGQDRKSRAPTQTNHVDHRQVAK